MDEGTDVMGVIYGYVRKSTDDDVRQPNSIETQRERIQRWADGRHVEWREERASARTLAKRPVLTRLLDDELREGDTLVVQRVDRLARSVIDGARMIERAQKEGWGIVLPDLNVDTTDPDGELVVNVILAVARWESRMLGKRTAATMAKLKREGKPYGGRPREIPDDVRRRIRREFKRCESTAEVARILNEAGIPPVRGQRWYHSTIKAVLLQEKMLT